MNYLLLLLTTTVYLADCLPPPHPAVVAVRREEQQLDPHLRKPALRNPRLLNILPLTSSLHHGENPVFDREADKIPRENIFRMLAHAGFLSRKRFQQPQLEHIQILQEYIPSENEDFSYFDELLKHPDFLQNL